MRGVWSVLVAAAAAACITDEADDPRSRLQQCRDEPADADLAGTWLLTGSGVRTGCSDSRFEGDFRIEASVGLVIAQQDNDPNADTLTLISPNDPAFTFFNAFVDGTCVELHIPETTSEGDLAFLFTGDAVDDGRVSGEFEGTGPQDRVSTGTFDVTVTLWPSGPSHSSVFGGV